MSAIRDVGWYEVKIAFARSFLLFHNAAHLPYTWIVNHKRQGRARWFIYLCTRNWPVVFSPSPRIVITHNTSLRHATLISSVISLIGSITRACAHEVVVTISTPKTYESDYDSTFKTRYNHCLRRLVSLKYSNLPSIRTEFLSVELYNTHNFGTSVQFN